MAPRRKITEVGGNLPLVAQFRVLCRPILLTARHSFLFFFPFPLFFFFLPHFSSLFFFPFLFFPQFSLFLSSLSLFPSSLSLFLLFSFPPPPSFFYELIYLFNLNLPCKGTYGLPCVTPMACHVSLTWISMFHSHGLPCITHMACHVSPDTRCLEIREISTISESNEIRLGG